LPTTPQNQPRKPDILCVGIHQISIKARSIHMRKRGTLSFWIIASSALCPFLCAVTAANAQSPSPAAAAPKLSPYTASDQSAQAGVPPGWNVTKGAETVIVMTGPNGETISLGNTFIVRNAPYQPNQRPANGIDLSIPNSASLGEKFSDIVQTATAVGGGPDPQTKIASTTPLALRGVQCGRLSGTFEGKTGPLAFGAVVCSLPVDTGGTYKVMMILAQAPPSVAAQEKALAGAVFASYRIAPVMLQKKLAPHFAPPPPPVMPPGGGGVGFMPSPNDPVQNGCFDLVVIRETPDWQLPAKCRQ
jgi:hypothetical protein